MNQAEKALLIKQNIVAEKDLLNSDLFISGFELEFHSCNGHTLDNGSDDDEVEYDYVGARDYLRESIDSRALHASILINYIEAYVCMTPEQLEYEHFLRRSSSAEIGELINIILPALKEDVTREDFAIGVEAFIQDCLESITLRDWSLRFLNNLLDMDDFVLETDKKEACDLVDAKEFSGAIEVKSDSSVRGGEVILDKPLPPKEALLVSKALFDNNDWEIDEGCSFHIHLSVPGLTHIYSEGMQWELMLYIMSQYKRVPQSVRDRWSKKQDYFLPMIQPDKYSFVHFHRQLKTWEFRCFGNVKNQKDAERCYLLALEAMRHVYSIHLGMKKPTSAVFSTSANVKRACQLLQEQLKKKQVSIRQVQELLREQIAA